MKEKEYSEWMSKQGFDLLRHANCCKIAFNGGWESRQTEVDELQKRVDASLIAFEKLKEEINELHGQCDLHLIKYLEEKAQVLEQALKGDQ